MTSDDLWYGLERFEARDDDGLRVARRPAKADLVVEVFPDTDAQLSTKYLSLAAFWLAALWRFLQDNQRNVLAFEGLAFQAVAHRLSLADFVARYDEIRSCLTLSPPLDLELRESYAVLQGRLTSLTGVTTDGEFWACFYQAEVFRHAESYDD